MPNGYYPQLGEPGNPYSTMYNTDTSGGSMIDSSGQTQYVPQAKPQPKNKKLTSPLTGQQKDILTDIVAPGLSQVSRGLGYAAGGGYSGGTEGGVENFVDPQRAISMQTGNIGAGSPPSTSNYSPQLGEPGNVYANTYNTDVSQQPQGQVLPQSNASVIPVNKNNAPVVQQIYKPQQSKKSSAVNQDVYRMIASQYNVSKKPGEITLDKEGILNSFSPQDKQFVSALVYDTSMSYLDKIDGVLNMGIEDKQKASVLALLAHQEGDKSNILVVHDGSKGGFSVLQFDSVKEKRGFKDVYYNLGKSNYKGQQQFYNEEKKVRQPKRK